MLAYAREPNDFFPVCGETTDRTRHAMPRLHRLRMRCAMSNSERRRKHELECLRLASDLRQLARDVSDPALQARFVRMARAFQDQAEELRRRYADREFNEAC